MIEYMLLPLKRYADFQGRSRRTEYWMFALLNIIVALLLGGIVGVATGFDMTGMAFYGLIGLYFLAVLIPSIAVQVRRFHDQDKSGWFVLIGFIPYIGGLIVLVFMCLEGTKGPNKFGPDPKDDAVANPAAY